ncbi:hypothetical protein EON83_10945 [bacterium]|nr:MAG: hypothetical protein EON83_10945 [bacterium]
MLPTPHVYVNIDRAEFPNATTKTELGRDARAISTGSSQPSRRTVAKNVQTVGGLAEVGEGTTNDKQ